MLLQISLHLVPRPGLRLIGVLCELPMGAPLTKQIPTLVKRLLKITKSARSITDLAGVILHFAAQLMFSIDHLANAGEDVGVVHAPQPR